MKTRVFTLLAFLVTLALLFGPALAGALAQGPTPPVPASHRAPDEAGSAEPAPFSTFGTAPASAAVQPSASDWHIECADCPKQFSDMTNRSLRLDDGDHPHIAYGGDHLYYARHDGAQWHYETVDESSSVGGYASLALDGTGRPHISYHDSANGDLKYAWHDGATWHIETVDSAGDVGWYSSLALDGAGRPHISYYYYASNNGDLKYARHDGTTWHIETVDSAGLAGPYSSLALDESGRPHISYCWYGSYPDRALKYAWHDGTAWRKETVSTLSWCCSTSLVLDGSGRPHISYCSSAELQYAWHDGTQWHIETVDNKISCSGQILYTSLALPADGSGRLHISYGVGNLGYCWGVLKHAWYDGTTWHIETVDSEGGWYPSLALDGTSRPRIGYYDRANDELRYAWHDGTTWHIETVDSEGYVGQYPSLALDELGRPHISYFDGYYSYNPRCGSYMGNGDLKYAWYDGAAWHTETVDSEGWVGESTALALDGLGRPHISYYHGSDPSDALKYAWHDGTAWHTETVDSGGSVAGYTSLALDGAGRPHIGYSAPGGVQYAWHDGTTWHIETAGGGGSPSLVLDGLDRPHISYSGNGLKYAWHDGTAWHTETVDDGGGASSLALDGSDRPHISYISYLSYPDKGLMKYAWHDGTTWHIETVDDARGCNSLALDRLGRPHISYCHGSYPDYALKYAWHDGAGWHIETMGVGGTHVSLALDRSSQPHVGYYDDINKKLKYAWRLTPLFLDKQAVPRDGLRNSDTLTYTLTLFGLGLNARLWDPLPANVHYVSNTIASNVTPPAAYSPTARAVFWQGTLPTDTVPVIRFQVTPGITGTGALSLSAPIVNTAWLTDTQNDRSVSAMVIVNGRYFYLPLALREGYP